MSANGQLLSSELRTIPGTTRRVLAALLPQTVALRNAFEQHFKKALVITDGYRPYDEQVDVFQRYYTTTYQPGRPTRQWQGRTYWQRPGFPSAAVPGTSNHGWGTALDLGSGVNGGVAWNPASWTPEHRWMRENGPRFGWHHPVWAHDNKNSNGTDEPWHFEASTTPVTVSNPGTGTGGVDIDIPNVDPIDPLEEDMPSVEEVADAVWNRHDAIGTLRSIRSDVGGVHRAVIGADSGENARDAEDDAVRQSILEQIQSARAEIDGVHKAVVGSDAATRAQLTALTATVQTLAAHQGVDPDRLLEMVREDVRNSLAQVEVESKIVLPKQS